MSNETGDYLDPKVEEKKLTDLYTELLEGTARPSEPYQKKIMFQLLNTKITKLEPRTNRIKYIHYFIRITAMLLSGAATVILGLRFSENSTWTTQSANIALVITAIVTFLSGLAVFWDTENYWKRNKVMLNKLKELRYEYAFIIAGRDIDQKDLRKILDKYLDALGDEYWEKMLKNVKTP